MADWYERLGSTIGKHVWMFLDSVSNDVQRRDVVYGSPIEEMFATSLIAMSRMYGFSTTFNPHFELADVKACNDGRQFMFIIPQAEVSGHRVDFLVALSGTEKILPIIVECDGHDFHERTKEQAARDRSRDRDFQSRGFMVMRFTGGEIWNDAFACANEVVEAIDTYRINSAYEAYVRVMGNADAPASSPDGVSC